MTEKTTQVEIVNNGNPLAGTSLYINGQKVPSLHSVSVEHVVGNAPVVSCKAYGLQGFTLKLPAVVSVHITALEGIHIVKTYHNDGAVTYKAKKV